MSMRKVQLSENAKSRGVNLSTFAYENKSYRIEGPQSRSVRSEIADAWVSADSNVVIMCER